MIYVGQQMSHWTISSTLDIGLQVSNTGPLSDEQNGKRQLFIIDGLTTCNNLSVTTEPAVVGWAEDNNPLT